jgi:stage II sporulation protein D
MGAAARTVVVEGCPVRAWRENGTVAAESNGSLTLSADGNRIRAGSAVIDGPVDVGADATFSVSGHRLPAGRARVVNRQGKLVAIATLPLEEYVAAVLSREGSASFRPAALSALAVAVRTYAVNAMAKPRDPDFDLLDGVDDQVFDGFDRVFPQFRAAVEETRGLLLWYGEATARANYHSTCGGHTESAADVWGRAYPYLVSVACDDCRDSPAYRWECRLTGDEGRRISLQLGLRGRGDLRFEVIARTETGRAARIRLSSAGATREVTGAAFRQAAGTTRVKSLQLEIERAGDGWKVTGTGYGHGVGLCQWGADGMARRGCDFREILARYYPGTRVEGGTP